MKPFEYAYFNKNESGFVINLENLEIKFYYAIGDAKIECDVLMICPDNVQREIEKMMLQKKIKTGYKKFDNGYKEIYKTVVVSGMNRAEILITKE